MREYPSVPNVNLPDDATVAASLGIEGLSVGRQYLRDEQRSRIGCIWLDTLWQLRVQPSFDHYGFVGVISIHGEEFRGIQSRGWTKAVLASDEAFAVQEIEFDPLPSLVASLPLLRQSNSGFLDGIGYQLRAESMVLEGSLNFANPVEPELTALEIGCWQLADEIARKSQNKVLMNFTKTWRRYHDR